jgi:hypothetical protein
MMKLAKKFSAQRDVFRWETLAITRTISDQIVRFHPLTRFRGPRTHMGGSPRTKSEKYSHRLLQRCSVRAGTLPPCARAVSAHTAVGQRRSRRRHRRLRLCPAPVPRLAALPEQILLHERLQWHCYGCPTALLHTPADAATYSRGHCYEPRTGLLHTAAGAVTNRRRRCYRRYYCRWRCYKLLMTLLQALLRTADGAAT